MSYRTLEDRRNDVDMKSLLEPPDIHTSLFVCLFFVCLFVWLPQYPAHRLRAAQGGVHPMFTTHMDLHVMSTSCNARSKLGKSLMSRPVIAIIEYDSTS
jgi:hypothetical protein